MSAELRVVGAAECPLCGGAVELVAEIQVGETSTTEVASGSARAPDLGLGFCCGICIVDRFPEDDYPSADACPF